MAELVVYPTLRVGSEAENGPLDDYTVGMIVPKYVVVGHLGAPDDLPTVDVFQIQSGGIVAEHIPCEEVLGKPGIWEFALARRQKTYVEARIYRFHQEITVNVPFLPEQNKLIVGMSDIAIQVGRMLELGVASR